MTQEEKQVVMTFLGNCYNNKLMEDLLFKEEEEMWNLLWKLDQCLSENTHSKEREFFFKLEDKIASVLELAKWRYFEYGEMAGEIGEDTLLVKNPFKRESA